MKIALDYQSGGKVNFPESLQVLSSNTDLLVLNLNTKPKFTLYIGGNNLLF